MAGFGGQIKLKGEENYRQALQRINTSIRSVGSELKYVSSEFAKNGSKISDLTKQNEVLTRKIDEERKAIELSKKAIKTYSDEKEKQREKIAKLNTSLNQEKQALERMKTASNSSEEAIKAQAKKVSDLTVELAKADRAHKNSEKEISYFKNAMFKSKAAISEAEVELNKNNNTMNKAKQLSGDTSISVEELAKAEKKVGEESSNAGLGVVKLGDLIKANLLSDAIKAGINALADSIKQFAGAVVNIGKTSVKEFASYEQLVGGVKTLFKDSAPEVEKYANNAYKTAGLTANQYMETVTSFSASLLQSLDNDTSKAAKVSDMAIRDMSDNANKMGTSMESIQNAYQGFAKQNYTMLDNLKLGYGGTKSEMERLLKKAGEISKVKYDINSLNDVYQAIHVIQNEMGMTGTTTEEMSTTLEGAFKGLKSNWGNLVTSFAKGNADFSQIGNNLIDSLTTTGKLLIPVISRLFDNVAKALPQLVQSLVQTVLPMIGTGITTITTSITQNLPVIMQSLSSLLGGVLQLLSTSGPQIVDVIVQGFTGLVTIILENLPMFIEVGVNLITALLDGLSATLPELIPTLVDGLLNAVMSLLDNLDKLIDAGIKMVLSLVDGLINAMPKIIDKMPEIIDKLIIALVDNLPKLIEGGITLVVKLAVGMIKAIPQLILAIPKIISSLVGGFMRYLGNIWNLGKDLIHKLADGIFKGQNMGDVGLNLVKGIWNGISNATQWILDKIKGFGQSVLNGLKSFFGIHSPSRKMRDVVGVNLAKGIGEGFTEEMSDVNKQIQGSLPTDYELSSNISLNSKVKNNMMGKSLNQNDMMILNFQKALEGMAFKVDGDKMGELVISNVEKVVF